MLTTCRLISWSPKKIQRLWNFGVRFSALGVPVIGSLNFTFIAILDKLVQELFDSGFLKCGRAYVLSPFMMRRLTETSCHSPGHR